MSDYLPNLVHSGSLQARRITITDVTVTLTLRPELEAGLLAQARANGMTLEQYLLSLIEGATFSAPKTDLSPQERATAFESWSANHRHTENLSDYAVSRESMYKDRND